jgi:Ca2+-binding EF-hand superfamily protein
MGSKFYAKKSKDDIVSAFKQFDKDNNGSISIDELNEVMKKFRGNLSKSDVEELVKKVDKDGNGSINIAGKIEIRDKFSF